LKKVRPIWAAFFGLLLFFPVWGISYSNEYRSPRNPERRIRRATRMVVLHTTEAHARSSLNKLCERGECHYCVTENGTVYRIIDRDREAFHAGRSMWNGKEDCDEYSIGIEVVGNHDKPVTLQQLDALRELLATLKSMYGLTDTQILCHSHVAYGAPNKWHKVKHRGRKRCGMLFAMASVRTRLGLKLKPASDPDVRAGRLIQGDPYLSTVLYGTVDTMRAAYRRAPVPAKTAAARTPWGKRRPPEPIAAKKDDDDGGFFGFFKRKARLVVPPQEPPLEDAKPAGPPVPDEEETPASKPTPGFVRGTLIGAPEATARPRTVVRPVSRVPATSAPAAAEPAAPAAAPAPASDPARDLEALRALPGYVQLGPVTRSLSAYKLAGRAWNAPTTYYWNKGVITPGNKVDPARVGIGTLIFIKR